MLTDRTITDQTSPPSAAPEKQQTEMIGHDEQLQGDEMDNEHGKEDRFFVHDIDRHFEIKLPNIYSVPNDIRDEVQLSLQHLLLPQSLNIDKVNLDEIEPGDIPNLSLILELKDRGELNEHAIRDYTLLELTFGFGHDAIVITQQKMNHMNADDWLNSICRMTRNLLIFLGPMRHTCSL